MTAAVNGSGGALRWLLAEGADINAVCDDGDTAVHYASAQGHVDMIEILAAAGCDLALTSRDLERAEAAAERLRSDYGHQVESTALDICDPDQVAACAKRIPAADVLINNAGGGLDLHPTHFFDRDPLHIAQLIDTNLTGMLYCCQAFGRYMAARGSGSIINIASIAGLFDF